MQDRYAGDIGDFGKFGLLKELSHRGLSIGVNWYKTLPLKSEKKADGTFKQDDGRHKDYLRLRHAAIAKWEDLDTISEIMTEGKNRDDLKNCDRMMVRESRRFLY